MNLTTSYLGLELKNPLIAGASPLNGELDNIRQLEDLGAGAIVLPSIFEEQIEHEEQRSRPADADPHRQRRRGADVSSPRELRRGGPGALPTSIRRAVDAVDVPVIASLYAHTIAAAVEYARRIEQAGAHGARLTSISIPSDPGMSGGDVEQRYIDIVKAVKAAGRPVAVKIGPHFSAIGHMAL